MIFPRSQHKRSSVRCTLLAAFGLGVAVLAATGCSDDDNNGPILSPAQQTGIGAACQADMPTDCAQAPVPLQCLSFKGGYCGLQGCTKIEDCPLGSACVAHSDGQSYCFLTCVDKIDCNATRSPDVESNCSSNITFVGNERGKKACVPPS